MGVKKLALVLMAGTMFSSVAVTAYAQDDYLARRQKLMKHFSAENKAIKAAMQRNDHRTIVAKAKELASSMDMAKFATHWPHNSTDTKSRAKAEIWRKWDNFMEHSYNGQQRALELADAAKAGDSQKVGDAFKAMGQVCSDCHKQFRAEAKKSR